MRRSAFKSTAGERIRAQAAIYQSNREQRLANRALAAIKIAAEEKARKSASNRTQIFTSKARTATIEVAKIAVLGPRPKQAPVRSEAYRRAVASMPCASCGIEGFSQHAHENDGKGKAQKLDDRRAMPLCCTRLDSEGCHVRFDQYRLLPGGRQAHIDAGRRWARETRQKIAETGNWPAKVPAWGEDVKSP